MRLFKFIIFGAAVIPLIVVLFGVLGIFNILIVQVQDLALYSFISYAVLYIIYCVLKDSKIGK